jgi:hypothetical protein
MPQEVEAKLRKENITSVTHVFHLAFAGAFARL